LVLHLDEGEPLPAEILVEGVEPITIVLGT
jgi:hypothetical protein